MLAGALFIAPFFLFSGASGTLADRIDKAAIARWVKVAEIGIMALGACGPVAAERAAAARRALLPRHALDGLRADQVRAAAAAPARRRARRRQRADRSRHLPRDPARHDPRRQHRALRPTARSSSASCGVVARVRPAGCRRVRFRRRRRRAGVDAPRPRAVARHRSPSCGHAASRPALLLPILAHLVVLAVRRDRRVGPAGASPRTCSSPTSTW